MLLEFFEYLSNYYSGFSVFQYITLRSILSALTAIVISFLIGPIVIEKLALRKVGEVIREEGPESHYNKAGTPTMGGMLILISWDKITKSCKPSGPLHSDFRMFINL